MAKFYFSAHLTVSAFTEVEADTMEEAMEIAEGRDVAGLCANPYCSDESESWHFEGDGLPQGITGEAELEGL